MENTPEFDGPVYESEFDIDRLSGQILRVYECMQDSKWRTLDKISKITGDPHASVSAQLRHLRKTKFGSHTVNKRSHGDRLIGLWEYQLVVNE